MHDQDRPAIGRFQTGYLRKPYFGWNFETEFKSGSLDLQRQSDSGALQRPAIDVPVE